MPLLTTKKLKWSARDLDFLIDTAAPEARDKHRLRQIITEDEDFRRSFVTDEKVFRRVMDDQEIFLKISPILFFEILLRRTARNLKDVSYTVEKVTSMKIPVFDSNMVVDLLNKDDLLVYLADMLASFTRIESYAISFRIRKGVWKKIRFNDLDIHSLMGFSEAVDEPYRFAFYKRIADICLFILGIFPDFAERDFRYPFSGQLRPHIRGEARISPEEYEKEGRKFYRLAADHQSARNLALSDVFRDLHGHFEKARKPLNFIADHYLRCAKHQFFMV